MSYFTVPIMCWEKMLFFTQKHTLTQAKKETLILKNVKFLEGEMHCELFYRAHNLLGKTLFFTQNHTFIQTKKRDIDTQKHQVSRGGNCTVSYFTVPIMCWEKMLFFTQNHTFIQAKKRDIGTQKRQVSRGGYAL